MLVADRKRQVAASEVVSDGQAGLTPGDDKHSDWLSRSGRTFTEIMGFATLDGLPKLRSAAGVGIPAQMATPSRMPSTSVIERPRVAPMPPAAFGSTALNENCPKGPWSPIEFVGVPQSPSESVDTRRSYIWPAIFRVLRVPRPLGVGARSSCVCFGITLTI
jgi:hypothetical protein